MKLEEGPRARKVLLAMPDNRCSLVQQTLIGRIVEEVFLVDPVCQNIVFLLSLVQFPQVFEEVTPGV